MAVIRKCIEITNLDGITVVDFTNRKILDEQNIQIIGEQLFSLADQLGKKKILLNLSDIECISTLALGKFITLQKIVNNSGGKLVICSIRPEVMPVFEITKLSRLFNITTDLPGGISALITKKINRSWHFAYCGFYLF